jgi:UDP-N-acetylglucosamine 4,6-dehydratase
LLTGGTGTFGRHFLEHVLPLGAIVRVYSRDERKQAQLREEFREYGEQLRFLIGDVRELRRVIRSTEGVDAVVHAAALKRVDACEYNPFEAIKTNVLGSQNVVEAALAHRVPRSILLSSDKAVHPVNLYGASKLCAEKLWLAANAYSGPSDVHFSCVRYGNVLGSRGSVLERWSTAHQQGKPVELRDQRATRFWLSPKDAVDLVLNAAEVMAGGEVYIPKASSSRILELVPEGAKIEETGLQPGEKLHELLISEEEIPRTYDCGAFYAICPQKPEYGIPVPAGFQMSSAA